MTSPINVSARPVRRPSDVAPPSPNSAFFGSGKVGPAFQPGMDRQNPPTGHAGADIASLQIVVTGPYFAGLLPGLIAAMVDEMQSVVTAQGLANVQANLDQSIQHPTPYYETQITLQRQADDIVVHDRGIAYGPWLEGTSSRNHATRFKGYHSFRRATEQLRQQAPALVGHVAQRYVGEMNG